MKHLLLTLELWLIVALSVAGVAMGIANIVTR